MANVYAVIEYLPIGAAGAGAGGEAVLSEHPTWDGAVAAKQNLYARRPELVGCLTVRAQAATLPVAPPPPAPVVTAPPPPVVVEAPAVEPPARKRG